MSASKQVEELDIVRLKDGREGTVLEVFDKPGLPLAYELEFDGPGWQLETVKADQVDKVIWKAPKHKAT